VSGYILNYNDVLSFWFEEIRSAQWFAKSDELDTLIIDRFSILHAQAARAELYEWRETARGRLAEIIVLDQFSRNMYRNSPLAFACDPLALVLAQEAIRCGASSQLNPLECSFLYMPLMHSESLLIHAQAVKLFESNGIAMNLEYELKHKAIIEKFGRYPHRNTVFGRSSTPEELEFIISHPGF